jgi:glycosyltransferase involved in cell wall biosynthesis
MLIDVTRLLYRLATGVIPTGIDRVGLEYVRHYAGRARAVLSWRMFAAAASVGDSTRIFQKLLAGANGVPLLALEALLKSFTWYWLCPGIGRRILFNTSYLWTEHSSYALQLRTFGARPVYFVHDLIPITHSEYFRPGQRLAHFRRMRVALTTGFGIIVNSRDTRDAVLRHAEAEGVQCPPIVVAPLAPAVQHSVAPGARPIAEPYFVVLGTIEPRKNHLLLLHVWRELIQRLGAHSVPRLYVIGQRGWECENVVDLLERCEPLKGVVMERNDCNDLELGTLLHHAQALLMPSFAEGFGLPVAEALAAGVPVVVSDLPAIREIAGDVPDYVDPLDGMRWAEVVCEYAKPNSSRRASQIERMRNHRPSTWAQHFEAVDAFLEGLRE